MMLQMACLCTTYELLSIDVSTFSIFAPPGSYVSLPENTTLNGLLIFYSDVCGSGTNREF